MQAPWLLLQVIGAPLAAGILYMDGVGGLRGWQWLFILEGCITAIYGIILKVRPLTPFSDTLPAVQGCPLACYHYVALGGIHYLMVLLKKVMCRRCIFTSSPFRASLGVHQALHDKLRRCRGSTLSAGLLLLLHAVPAGAKCICRQAACGGVMVSIYISEVTDGACSLCWHPSRRARTS